MFNIEKENIDTKYLLILLAMAYIFSIGIRMIWVYQFSGFDNFIWNNQLMINTNDGYYFATAVKNLILNSNLDNPQLSSAVKNYPGVIYTTLLLSKILPFSLDSIILYMPAFTSSLVVIPIILTMRLFNHTIMGFFSALIGSVAWSYYNRTMIGYYDSDMFAVLMQFFVLYSLLAITIKRTLTSVLIASILIVLYPLFYPQGLSLIYGMYLLLSMYMIYFFRKEHITYIAIIILSASLFAIPIYLKLLLLIVVSVIFYKKVFELKQLIYISIISFVIFLFAGNVVGLIIGKVFVYLDRGTKEEGLSFFQVIQTVREAGTIPFSTMANRISGSSLGVIVALIGYVLLVVRHKQFIIALPLIGIGVFSLWGGLRFTVYAVPVAAMSSVFLFYTIASLSQKNIIKYPLIITFTIAMLYPNIVHIVGYKVPTVFNKPEVQILDKLKSISTPKDYTLTWWDYGYPIWYYTNTNTLLDGGKHHNDNFIISQILNTSSPTQAANLARLAVETYVSSDYKVVANEIFKNKTPEQIDPNIMLDELRLDDYSLPAKTRDVYIYLPNRMLDIFPTVTLFSNLDLVSGKKGKRPFYYKSNRFQDSKDSINLGNNIKIIKAKGQIQIGMQSIGINNFVTTVYDNNKILRKQVQKLNLNGNINVIFMKNYNQFLILDNKMYNSLFIQMFVLENYDKSLFEPVILEPLAKVYRLKI